MLLAGIGDIGRQQRQGLPVRTRCAERVPATQSGLAWWRGRRRVTSRPERAQLWAVVSQRMRMVSSAALVMVKQAQVSQAVWISGSAAPSMATAA